MGYRSDTKKFAKCGKKSYYYCIMYGHRCADYECNNGINKKRITKNQNNDKRSLHKFI